MADTHLQNLQKLANISAATYSPIPKLLIPELPDKLKKIDPEGCAKWHEDFVRLHDDWVDKQNVVQQNITNSLKA